MTSNEHAKPGSHDQEVDLALHLMPVAGDVLRMEDCPLGMGLVGVLAAAGQVARARGDRPVAPFSLVIGAAGLAASAGARRRKNRRQVRRFI